MNNGIRQTAARGVSSESDELFGREHDLKTVAAMLRSSECRLVTLSGPGGIGKTSLAQRIVEQLHADFEDGVCFVSLHAVASPEQLATTVLEHVGCGLRDTASPTAQVLQSLRDKQLLLVLDNFEHLLGARDIVAAILEQTARVKLMITSRAVLSLHQEWVWPLKGISYPRTDDATDAVQCAAVRLFDARARRVYPGFELRRELSAVIRICALAEGSPLVIELAAAWAKSLTCQDILEEMRRDIDMLSSEMWDVPDQHRSLRAVFERSWRLLTAEERNTLVRLSFFHGEFTRSAAKAIAGLTLPLLAALIDKSLLAHNRPDGWYQLHELFRQYVHTYLLNDAELLADVRTAFIAYYRDFLAARAPDMWNSRQRVIVQEITAQLHNIRRVSGQLALTEDAVSSRKAAYVLAETYQLLGYYRECVDFCGEIIAAIEGIGEDRLQTERLHLLAEALNGLGWSYLRLGEFSAAEEAITRAQVVYETHRIQPAVGLGTDPRAARAELRSILGDFAAAGALGQVVYSAALGRNDPLNSSTALYLLSSVALSTGDHVQARAYIQQAIALARRAGNEWFVACCLYQEGHIHREELDYASAYQRFEESYRIRRAFGDLEGQAVALNHMSDLSLLQERYAAAVDLLRQYLSLYRRIGDRGGLLSAHRGLAIALTALGDFDQASRHLIDATQIAREGQLPSWQLAVCEAAGEFYSATGERERGIGLVKLALQHPESSSVVRARAEHWLLHHEQELGSAAQIDLSTVSQQLEVELLARTWISPASRVSHDGQSGFFEPLSERELEILRLIREGLTNREIADRLCLTVGTVKTHNYNIFGKLAVKNRVQAIRRARQLRLL